MRLKALGAMLLFLLTTAAMPLFAKDLDGVAIREKNYEPTDDQLTFSLCNENEKTLTAWSFSVVVAHGDDAERFSVDHDYHIRLYNRHKRIAERTQGNGLIAGGECQAFQLAVTGAARVIEPRALSLRLVAVIFDDASSTGERLSVTRLFSQRAAIVAQLQQSLDHLNRIESKIETGRSSVGSAAAELREYASGIRKGSAVLDEGSAGSTRPSAASAKREALRASFISLAAALENDSVDDLEYLRIVKQEFRGEYEFRLKHSWFGGHLPSES